MHYIEWPIFWGGILKALDINNGYLTHLINLLVSLRYFPILNSLTYSCISWFKISKYRMPFILRNDLIRWIKCKSLYCRFFCLKSSFDRINAVHRLPIYSIKETDRLAWTIRHVLHRDRRHNKALVHGGSTCASMGCSAMTGSAILGFI
jgi:hypothetical protein